MPQMTLSDGGKAHYEARRGVSADRGAAKVDKIHPTNQPAFLMSMTLGSRKKPSFDTDDEERSITSTPHQASPGLPWWSQAQQCD